MNAAMSFDGIARADICFYVAHGAVIAAEDAFGVECVNNTRHFPRWLRFQVCRAPVIEYFNGRFLPKLL